MRFSPLLGDEDCFKIKSKIFIAVRGLDSRKDQALIYSERLRKSGTDVSLFYYENAIHGKLSANSNKNGIKIKNDFLNFVKKNI